MKKIARSSFLLLAPLAQNTFANEGHGLGSTHWHATDALGFVIAAALVAVAFHLGKK